MSTYVLHVAKNNNVVLAMGMQTRFSFENLHAVL